LRRTGRLTEIDVHSHHWQYNNTHPFLTQHRQQCQVHQVWRHRVNRRHFPGTMTVGVGRSKGLVSAWAVASIHTSRNTYMKTYCAAFPPHLHSLDQQPISHSGQRVAHITAGSKCAGIFGRTSLLVKSGPKATNSNNTPASLNTRHNAWSSISYARSVLASRIHTLCAWTHSHIHIKHLRIGCAQQHMHVWSTV
jgi:hypothetical protein